MSNFKWITGLSLTLALLLVGSNAFASKTIYSDLEIPEQCEKAYASGIEVFSKARAMENKNPLDEYDVAMEKVSIECQLYFSLGVFDAEAQAQQRVVLEFLLDMYLGNRTEADPKVQKENMKRLYRDRFEDIGLQANLVEKMLETDDWRQAIVPDFIEKMYDIVKKEGEAVTFGRFIFTNSPNRIPKSIYRYVWDEDGNPKKDASGKVVLETGTYQHIVRHLFDRTNKTVKDYMEWKPALFFGEDSHYWGIYGRMWHKFRTGEELSSIRDLKEERYFDQIDYSIKSARKLSLDIKPFYDAKRLMLKKQSAVLESEIGAYTKTMYALYAAPLIPVGMYVGAAGFVGAGLSSLPAGTGSFTLATSSLVSAANVSAMLAAAPMLVYAGIGTNAAVTEWRESGAFNLSRSLDMVVGATVQSFPLAAALPAIVGQGANGVVKAFVSAKSVIASGFKFAKSLKALGFKGSASHLAKLPMTVVKKLSIAWWHSWKTNWKLFLRLQTVDTISSVFFECVGRASIGDGCVIKNEDGGYSINPASKLTLGTTLIGGLAGRPFINIKSLAGRMVAYRSLYFASSIITQMLFNGEVNGRRVVFELGYDGTVSSAIGEISRTVTLSSFITSKSPATQMILLTAWKLLAGVPSSAARNHFMNRWVADKNPPLDDLRAIVRATFNIDLADIDDEALLESLERFEQEGF